MTDKEILAELKISYNYLLDIMENSEDEQLDNIGKKKLDKILDELSIEYAILWKKTNSNLEYEKDILISDCISFDYVDKNDKDNFMQYDEINKKTKWYEDYDFISELKGV